LCRAPPTHTPVFDVTAITRRRDAPTGHAAWPAVSRDNRLLGTTLGIDATKPRDPGVPEVAEPPRSLWDDLSLQEYLT